jgi:capsule polysaccharide export protein KpsC/LpsZ
MPGERHILLALATGHNTEVLLAPFVQAIAARPRWRWWVRAHPGMAAAETNQAKQVLSSVPGGQVELEASELPLYAILRHVDATASVSSGVAVEAALMGVPSIVTDVDVEKHFHREIEAGWVVVASSDVAGALDHQMQRATELDPYAPPRLTPDDALDMLLPQDMSRRE